ncbi:HNH endonuclease [Niallia sp. 03190]|uniref:HNH endonuclease n=1 Tax=Niallia sp. 03190 TaxID=3458061 RepID=UPI0040441AD2
MPSSKANLFERIKGNKLRYKILERDNYQCVLCGNTNELEVHHMLALYLGGKSTEDNLITLCSECHKYAPENGTEANMMYLKYRNRVAYEQLMQIPDLNAMVVVAYVEFIKKRFGEYIEKGFLNKEQAEEILFYETEKLY